MIWHSLGLCQIKITNAVFPKAGDTLKYFTSLNVPGGLEMGNTGGPKTWDFNKLKAGFKLQEIYTVPSKGKDASFFPDANLLMLAEGQEQYVRVTTQVMELLGVGGATDFLDTNVVIRFTKRPTLRKAPLEFINSTFSQGEFRLDFTTRIIPDTLLNLLQVKPDSIRFQFLNTHRGLIDAFGTVKLYNKNYEVLREKAEIISESKVFMKVLGIWLDLSSIFQGNIPQGIGDLLTKDTTIAYNFYSNTKKEAIVSAEYNTSGILQEVTFIDEANLLSNVEVFGLELPFTIYPNPANDFIEIDATALKGNYSCIISDYSGKTMFFEKVNTDYAQKIRVDVSDWSQGIYIVRFLNANGSMSFLQKLIKN